MSEREWPKGKWVTMESILSEVGTDEESIPQGHPEETGSGQQCNEGMTADSSLLAVVTDDSRSQNPGGKSMDNKGAHMGLEAIYCQPGYELKIMLVGKSREENRRVGNIILGEQKFKEGRYRCECDTVENRVVPELTVVITPGLHDPKREEITLGTDLVSPGPHMFLLLVKPNDNLNDVLNPFKELFSEKVLDYTMLLLTDGHRLKNLENVSRSIKEFAMNNKNRYHILDDTKNDLSQVTQLIEKILKIIGENSCFTLNKREERREEETVQAEQLGEDQERRQRIENKKKLIKRVFYGIVGLSIMGSGVKDAMTCTLQ